MSAHCTLPSTKYVNTPIIAKLHREQRSLLGMQGRGKTCERRRAESKKQVSVKLYQFSREATARTSSRAKRKQGKTTRWPLEPVHVVDENNE